MEVEVEMEMEMEDEVYVDVGECRHHQGDCEVGKDGKESIEEMEDSVLGLENSL